MELYDNLLYIRFREDNTKKFSNHVGGSFTLLDKKTSPAGITVCIVWNGKNFTFNCLEICLVKDPEEE